jgi:chaperonin GroES
VAGRAAQIFAGLLLTLACELPIWMTASGHPEGWGNSGSWLRNMEDCMQFRPLHDRVLVRRIDADEKTAGGIIIPDTAKEKPQRGEVVAVGAGARNDKGDIIPLDVKAGDEVLFGKWSGTEVKIDGEDLLIMKESDILGVVEAGRSAKKAA